MHKNEYNRKLETETNYWKKIDEKIWKGNPRTFFRVVRAGYESSLLRGDLEKKTAEEYLNTPYRDLLRFGDENIFENKLF